MKNYLLLKKYDYVRLYMLILKQENIYFKEMNILNFLKERLFYRIDNYEKI